VIKRIGYIKYADSSMSASALMLAGGVGWAFTQGMAAGLKALVWGADDQPVL
jgi:hypothetical protein